jgi:hypothetical protein
LFPPTCKKKKKKSLQTQDEEGEKEQKKERENCNAQRKSGPAERMKKITEKEEEQ